MNSIDYLKKEASILINLFNAKKHDEAIHKAKILIKKSPEQILFYNILSLSLSAKGMNNEALNILKQGLAVDPGNILILNNLGLINSNLNLFTKAESYFLEALKKKPDFFEALINYGNLFLKKNQTKEAIKIYEKTVKIANTDSLMETALMSLGNTYQQIGNFEDSIKTYKKLLDINPNNTKADKAISVIHKYKDTDDIHLKSMEKKISNIKDDEALKSLNFALGKSYEDLGDVEKAFNHIKLANDIEKKQLRYDISKDKKIFNDIKYFFEKNELNQVSNPKKKIIFIVGMPRSGTTLTEQIISAHDEVHGAGELPYLSEFLIEQILEKNFLTHNKIDDLKNLLVKCQKHYFDKINIHNIKENIIIDKAPLNFRWIGFIQVLFPNSKIIHCKRDPLAVCWSNYKNSFSSKSIGFSYDLIDLGKYYKLYNELMSFWKNSYSKKIYDLDYNELVSNSEKEIRKIIEFCELSWDDKCLVPEKNKKSVSTASLSQVRSPIYKSSIGGWKKFDDKLDLLKKTLEIN